MIKFLCNLLLVSIQLREFVSFVIYAPLLKASISKFSFNIESTSHISRHTIRVLASEEDEEYAENAKIYTKPIEATDIIYKRLDETYESRDYNGAFDIDETEVTFNSLSRNDAGERMLRVLMIGGSSSEATILKSLSNMEDLICGTYTSWDESMGELHEDIPNIPFNNLFPCETPEDAAQQADLARFIHADIVIAGGSYSVPSKAEFVKNLQRELEGSGIGYISPSGAGAMLSGDFSMIQACVEAVKGQRV